MNVRKRGLALLMCICMIFTLLPFSAFAEDAENGNRGGTEGTAQPSVVYGQYDNNGKWKQVANAKDTVTYPVDNQGNTVTLKKTATPTGNENEYKIDLEVITTETSSTKAGDAATVLVIDVSGSMDKCAECGYTEGYSHNWIYGHNFKSRIAAAQTAAKQFIDAFKSDSAKRYVSVVRFSDNASVACEWKDVSTLAGYKAAIKAIEGLSADGGTNLDAGLQTANIQLSQTTVASIKANAKNVIALTDGMPTFYVGGDGKNGNHGNTGCPITNDRTAASATALKNSAALYTVCFGAARDKCWSDWDYNKRDDTYEYGSWPNKKYCSDSRHAQDGPTVGDFLKNSIATQATNDKTYAYNAANTNDLLDVFKSITDTITEGISAGTVKDGLPTGVSFVGNAPTAFVENDDGTYSWELIPENAVKGTDNGKTTYTYTVSYVVKLDTTDPEFNEDIYHALNTETTFTAGGEVYYFNVPGVKGTAPRYKVTYEFEGTCPDSVAVPASEQHKAGETVTMPEINAPEGWIFNGWKYDSEPVTSVEMPADDITIIGTFTERKAYTVKYLLNGTDISVKDADTGTKNVGDSVEATAPDLTGYTFAGTDADKNQTITVVSDASKNVITFYYYKNVELVANSATYLFDNTAKTVSGYKAYSTEDTAKETELNITFNGVTATRTETQPDTYDVTFTGTPVGAKDTSDKYIITKATPGELIINPAYQIIYEYKNAPENAPTCPVDNTYYADGTTVSPLQNPGTLDGYIFSGWKINGEGDAVTGVTFAGANITLIGEWKPVEGLTCTINYWWMGDSEKPMKTKTVDNLTFGQPYSASPETFDGYTVENGDEQTITIKTTGNVINFYYYKNVVLTADSDSVTYDGKTHTINTFKAIVAADRNADIADQLADYISASGEGTNVNKYPVQFKLRNELIPVDSLKDRVLIDIYYVTSASEGTLTITPRSVIITTGSASKTYDGTPLTKHESTITGEGFVEGQGVNITYTGSQTEVGSSENTFEYKLKDNTLEKNYTIETVFGTLTVEKRPYIPNPPITDKITVEITGNSDSVVYDGAEHSVKDYTVKISDSRYTEKDFTFSGKALASGINAGTYEMGLKADQFKNTNARFTNVEFIIKADGVLTITQRPLTITAGSAEGIAPVTCDKYTVEGLATGDKVDSVKITGIQSEPGESPNVASDAVIKNAKGEDVTANYKITYVNGVLKAIEVLNKEIHFNYVIGYTDGTIRPNNDISRAEVATIFFRLLTDEAREQYTTTAGNFTDVKAGMWCNRAIATLTNMGIIKGYTDGTFRPNADITRAELATIIARFAKLDVNTKTFSDINGHWAQKNIELAAGNGWINGYEDGTFRPNNNITRAETFAMINRVLDRQTESVSDLLPTSEMNMWSDNLNENAWYYKDVQEATNYHKCDRVGDSVYEKWTEKVPDIDWASYQI